MEIAVHHEQNGGIIIHLTDDNRQGIQPGKLCSVLTAVPGDDLIPSIVTVRTFFISKPSFDGFGKFSPKTKKRVPLSVPREQRVNALCMEKSVLHGFW